MAAARACILTFTTYKQKSVGKQFARDRSLGVKNMDLLERGRRASLRGQRAHDERQAAAGHHERLDGVAAGQLAQQARCGAHHRRAAQAVAQHLGDCQESGSRSFGTQRPRLLCPGSQRHVQL